MPEPIITAAVIAIVTLVEWSPRPLVPIGSLLALIILLYQAELGPIVILGALGAVIAHLLLAISARRGRDKASESPFVKAQRSTLQAKMSASGAFARITFTMAALPGSTARLLYPMLGAMQAPLLPAVAGSLVGRSVLYLFTTGAFVWLAEALTNNDKGEAANFMLVMIIVMLAFRIIRWIDWAYRSETGKWKLRDPNENSIDLRIFSDVSSNPFADEISNLKNTQDDDVIEGDILEGDIIAEDIDDDSENHSENQDQISSPPTS